MAKIMPSQLLKFIERKNLCKYPIHHFAPHSRVNSILWTQLFHRTLGTIGLWPAFLSSKTVDGIAKPVPVFLRNTFLYLPCSLISVMGIRQPQTKGCTLKMGVYNNSILIQNPLQIARSCLLPHTWKLHQFLKSVRNPLLCYYLRKSLDIPGLCPE